MALFQVNDGTPKLLQIVEYPVWMVKFFRNIQQITIIVRPIG